MTDVVCLLDEKVVWSSDVLGFEWDVREGDSAFPVPIRGSGQMFDDETGYCYQRARYYDPSIGRFLMPDPIGFYGGLNVYQFCLNQPFLFTDPLGLAACPLSEDDCNDIFNEVERKSASVQGRWQDMVDNKLDLPWDGMPGYKQLITTAAVGAARGTPWAVGDASMGSIDSHIKAHDEEQRGLQKEIQKYHEGSCSKYEDGNRAAAMQQHTDISTKPISCPDLGL